MPRLAFPLGPGRAGKFDRLGSPISIAKCAQSLHPSVLSLNLALIAFRPRFGAKKKSIAPPVATETASTSGTSSISGQLAEDKDSSNGAPSSRDLLNRMQARNRLLGLPGSISADDDSDEGNNARLGSANEEESLIANSDLSLEFASGVDYRSLMDDIRNFVAYRGVVPGLVTTANLLDEFNGRLPSRGAPLFRALLKQLCTFTRDNHGEGVWQLKPEFQ